MKRVIALITFFFLFLTTLESWAGFWLAGRWYVSSRFATVSLGTIKSWLDRGIINSSTQAVKIFIQRNGKWILLTLGLSQVIPEVQQRIQASQYCYDPNPITDTSSMLYLYVGSYSSRVSFSHPHSPYTLFYTLSGSCSGTTREGSGPYYLTTYRVYRFEQNRWTPYALAAKPGTYTLTSRDGITCTATLGWPIPLQPCGSVDAWQNERRQVPVRVFPNVNDFLRDDVIARDPALQWLRDEYQRIASDTSIPTIPADALGDLELPSIDWAISPDEALDFVSERGSPREVSREVEGDISIPGFDTNLPSLERRPFPIELINNLVQNHPLLRILQGVNFGAGSGGSCQVGSGIFTVDFCPYQWIFNLMGAIIVPIAFFIGLFGWRND
jgi:hypothetical protein